MSCCPQVVHLGCHPYSCQNSVASFCSGCSAAFWWRSKHWHRCAVSLEVACQGMAMPHKCPFMHVQEQAACSASQQALHAQDLAELQKLVTVLPQRLTSTVLEQPDFSQVSSHQSLHAPTLRASVLRYTRVKGFSKPCSRDALMQLHFLKNESADSCSIFVEPAVEPPMALHPLCKQRKASRPTASVNGDACVQLLEIVMDLGRPPLARFPSGDLRLADEVISNADLDHAISKVAPCSSCDRSDCPLCTSWSSTARGA